jgi:hypothetical protein
MADKVTPGLGRFNVGQPSAANNPYLKLVEEAGKKLGSVGKGYAAAQAEIGKRKASALKLVPEADFTSDTSPSGMFAADAKEIEDKVNGVGEDAYDFSNLNDVARFEKDVAKLNNELKEGELLYDQIIKNAEDLELAHEVYLQTGKNPTINVQGEQVVNELVEGDAYDNTIFALDKLRNSEVVKEGGKYKIKINGETVEEYDSKEEYFEDLAKITKARYKRAPVVSPAQTLFDRKYAALYQTKEKARERINIDVKNELDNEALKYYAQEKGVDDLSLVSREVGEDGLTDYQRFYAEKMEDEYVREQGTPTPVDTSGTEESVSKIPSFKTRADGTHYIDGGLTAQYITPGVGAKIEFQLMPLEKPVKLQASSYFDEGKVEIHALGPHPKGAEFMDVRIKTRKDVTRYTVITDEGERTFDTREAAQEVAGDLPITETSVEEIVTEDLVFDPLNNRGLSGKEKDILNAVKGNEAYMNWFTLAQEKASREAARR